MKNNDHNSNEPLQNRKYKKSFLLRQIETKEAEKQLKEFDIDDVIDIDDDSLPPKVD